MTTAQKGTELPVKFEVAPKCLFIYLFFLVYKILQGQFSMNSIQGVSAVYEVDLANKTSAKFIQLANIVCTQVRMD